jgi:probable rRNA maturation factor
MIEVEVFGAELLREAPATAEVRRLCVLAADSAKVHEGHAAITFVNSGRIAELNALHRAKSTATDVLSFPIDGAGPLEGPGPRELGDVVICPQHTSDVREAIVHGMLHLLGMDHETDDGKMLAAQRDLLTRASR